MLARYLKIAAVFAAFVICTALAFWIASALEQNTEWQTYVQSFGLLGVVLTGILCGLNAFVPIPAATFAPLFINSGLSPFWVVTGFVVGTTIADSIGYLLGWFGSYYVKDNHPKITNYFKKVFDAHERYIPFIVFAFFALAPLPNELILIPLALIGYQYKKLLLPLIIGNIIHHSIMVFGYTAIFEGIF